MQWNGYAVVRANANWFTLIYRLDGARNDLGELEMVISVTARQHQIIFCLSLFFTLNYIRTTSYDNFLCVYVHWQVILFWKVPYFAHNSKL